MNASFYEYTYRVSAGVGCGYGKAHAAGVVSRSRVLPEGAARRGDGEEGNAGRGQGRVGDSSRAAAC